MTVEELIAELQKFDQKMPVYCRESYSDRINEITTVDPCFNFYQGCPKDVHFIYLSDD